MTIICALHRGGETWVGSDSRTSFGSQVYDGTTKILFAPDRRSAIATCGPGRMRYVLERDGDKLFAGASAHTMADRIRQMAKDEEWPLKAENGSPKWMDGSAVYADTSGVAMIAADFCVIPMADGAFVAGGSGEQYARGAAMVAAEAGQSSEAIIRSALAAACAFDSACGGPLLAARLG